MTSIADMAEFRIQRREVDAKTFRLAVKVKPFLDWLGPRLQRMIDAIKDAAFTIGTALVKAAENMARSFAGLSSTAGQPSYPGVTGTFPRHGSTR